ncbi:MAG: hypothetical protein WCH44_08160 [Betaproteobacteria bacterium]
MQAAQRIRDAVAQVTLQRQRCADDAELMQALAQVKQLQALRFAASYADLLAAGPYREAAQFFLDELYGDKDFTQRDQQFARIAGALQRVFPHEVVATAVALSQLHALTETLDFSMSQAWLRLGSAQTLDDASRYVGAWREVGRTDERNTQLREVLALGREMEQLTRTPGLRLMLRMMRAPATAGGLGELQRFLESGFDHFAGMARKQGLTAEFLAIIEQRESRWINRLFELEPVACATELAAALGQAR